MFVVLVQDHIPLEYDISQIRNYNLSFQKCVYKRILFSWEEVLQLHMCTVILYFSLECIITQSIMID